MGPSLSGKMGLYHNRLTASKSHIIGNELPSLFQFSSVAQSCPTLCDPMNRSTPGLPVHHQLPEFTQTHVHWVGDAIQPSHPLSSPSPRAFHLSQHQDLFKWVGSLHQVAKVLELQLQQNITKINLQSTCFFINSLNKMTCWHLIHLQYQCHVESKTDPKTSATMIMRHENVRIDKIKSPATNHGESSLHA